MSRRASVALLSLIVVAACTTSSPGIDGSETDAAPLDGALADGGDSAAAVDASATAHCDEEGEVCCADLSCAGGLSCERGLCTAGGCGELGSACCEGSECDPGGVCEAGTCIDAPCGGEAAVCCATEPACDGMFECHDGRCIVCGGADEQCCPGEACDSGLFCEVMFPIGTDTCRPPPPCGQSGALCCTEGMPCGAGLACTSQIDDTGAEWRTCLPGAPCGGEGRVCCDGDVRCGPALQCTTEADGDRCRRCGEHGLQCCDAPAEPCGPGLACRGDLCELPAA